METSVSNNPTAEIWQVDAGGKIYQGSLEELTQWITEGAVLPQDLVRRGNLRWIEANKVPTLIKFFNIHNSGATVATNTPTVAPHINSHQAKFCLVHIETEATFLCDGCANFFCKDCPNTFGTSVKICPMCGAMCKSLEKVVEQSQKTVTFQRNMSEGFGLTDFGRAFVYPFKYPVSLIFGVLFYGFFTVTSQAASIGGLYMLVGAIFCWMLANMLTFGILSNTVENMLQGKTGENFMPSFDDFNIWDDAVHPLFLNISVYLSSFGALIILCIVMFFVLTSSMKNDSATAQKVLQPLAPDITSDFSDAQQANKQLEFFKEAVKKQNEQNAQRLNSVENGGQPPVNDEEKHFQNLNEQINQTRKAQLESAIGEDSKEEAMTLQTLFNKVMAWGIPYIVLAGIAFLWGLFYLPVAFIVAAYTRNIGSVFSLSVGLDTIKRLGVDYVKILLMCFTLWVLSVGVKTVLDVVFAPFDLPRLGNLAVIAVSTVVTFYLTIVFAVILGSALYKNSEKFPLFQTI